MYVEGFKYTVMSSVIAFIGSFILGIILAVMRIAPIRILNWIGTAYVEFVRNIPLVLIAFISILLTRNRNYFKWFCSRNS